MESNWIRVAGTLFLIGNVLPVLPIFVSATATLDKVERRRVFGAAVITGASAAIALVLVGSMVFGAAGIEVSDLRIAGGLILLVFAIYDLLFSRLERNEHDVEEARELGVVPLGIPVLMGPATLAAAMALSQTHGKLLVVVVLLALAATNMTILLAARRIAEVLGRQGIRALGKVMALLLAAIAVSMIRVGLQQAFAG